MGNPYENAQFFFLTPSIGLKFGGLTTALFRRAHIFTKNFANEVNVLTFKYQTDFSKVKKNLVDNGYTNKNIKVYNLYDFFSSCAEDIKVEDPLLRFANIKKIHENEFSSQEYELIKVEKNNFNKIITKLECYDKEYLIKIIELDENKNLKRIREFEKGNLISEDFYRNDQSIYMNKKFSGEKKPQIKEISLYEKNKEVVQVFTNHENLQKYWLNQLLDTEKTNYLINDGRAMDSLILNYKEKPSIKLFVIHSTHLREPYGTFSTLRMGNRILFEKIGQADGIVFLTEGQKKDMIERFGDREVFNVIPHSIEPKIAKMSPKIKNRFVVISRLHEEKQIDHIIKAFSLVKKAGFDFKLDIFGDGEQKSSLHQLIQKEQLEKNVFFKGFTTNPFQEFAESEGSILTSKYEGFGLSILESLSSHCPVFAYDLKYGPADMIKNGFNGYLVEQNNIADLAKAITTFMELPSDEKQKMFNNAFQSIKNFSEEDFIIKWKKVLENSIANSSHRYNLIDKKKFNFKLEQIKFENKNLYIQISVKLKYEPKENLIEKFGGIQIEINNQKFHMKHAGNKSTSEFLIYESLISRNDLKLITLDEHNLGIYYYVTIDGVVYRNLLKGDVINSTSHMQSIPWNVYQLVKREGDGISLIKQRLSGVKGFLRYIKYI